MSWRNPSTSQVLRMLFSHEFLLYLSHHLCFLLVILSPDTKQFSVFSLFPSVSFEIIHKSIHFTLAFGSPFPSYLVFMSFQRCPAVALPDCWVSFNRSAKFNSTCFCCFVFIGMPDSSSPQECPEGILCHNK